MKSMQHKVSASDKDYFRVKIQHSPFKHREEFFCFGKSLWAHADNKRSELLSCREVFTMQAWSFAVYWAVMLLSHKAEKWLLPDTACLLLLTSCLICPWTDNLFCLLVLYFSFIYTKKQPFQRGSQSCCWIIDVLKCRRGVLFFPKILSGACLSSVHVTVPSVKKYNQPLI